MKKIVSLILTLCLILGGCSYGEDADSHSYVIAVGIDKGEVFPLKLTFIFANPKGSSSGGGGGGEEEKKPASPSPDLVSVEAPTVFSAVRKLDSIKSRRISLTHTKIVIFSDEVAKEGVKTFLSGFASSRDFRPNTYVCISDGEAGKYLKSVKPSEETFIEKYYDNIMQKVVSDKASEAYLYYLFFNVADEVSGSLVPLCGVNENSLDEEKIKLFTTSDDFSFEARAGELVRDASNKSEILGAAVLRGDKMVGTLGSFHTDLARIISHEYYPKNYSISYPSSPDYVTVRLIQKEAPQIRSKIKNDDVRIDINVPLSIEYIDSGKIENDTIKSKQFCSFLETKLDLEAKRLFHAAQENYNSDFLGLGNSLKKHFPDTVAWKKFRWDKKFPLAKINISFKIVSDDFEETN